MSVFTLATVPKPRTEPVEVDGVTVVDGRAYLSERRQRRYDQRNGMSVEDAAQYRAARQQEREAEARAVEETFRRLRETSEKRQ
ncbi:MAG: hypothetical protein JSR96_13940 [Proteobacteria bacterium]|nr:hypothetical protein [Pseudomonadota bacterium]